MRHTLIQSDRLNSQMTVVQNEDAARKFVRATLRGVRDYCNAYHRAPNRAEITRILAKYSDVKDPALIVFTHTEIDDAFEGQGLGSTLVRAALDAARTRGLAVRPDCPFVRGYVARHSEYLNLVPEELRPRLGL